MPIRHHAGLIAALLIATAILTLAGCHREEESRWAEVQRQSARERKAVVPESAKGSSFNAFFPKKEAPYDLIYQQEKTGFAQASLRKDGKELATFNISDTANNPQATQKYKDTRQALAGYPVVAVGSQGTSLLVANRYQVQVRSIAPSFSATDRETWLKKFNLDGLASLR